MLHFNAVLLFWLQITLNNEHHNGQVTVELTSPETALICRGHVVHAGNALQ